MNSHDQPSAPAPDSESLSEPVPMAADEIDRLAMRAVPRQRRSIARRQAILDATLEMLAEEGMAGLSTSSIAVRAGVPVASVYAYFPNKFSIVAELGRQAMADVDGQLEQVLLAGTQGVNWEDSLDATISVVLAGYRSVRGRRHLFNAMRNNEMLLEVQVQSDLRMIEVLQMALITLRPDITAPQVEAIASTVVHSFTALQHDAVTCEDDAKLPFLVAEWRKIIWSYLLQYLGNDAV